MEKAREKLLKIFNLLNKSEMRILPGHLAFYIVLTIIPVVALIATITAALSISTDIIRQALHSTLPQEISAILDEIIRAGGINFNIVIFFISTFFLASNGTFSMINSANEIYKVRPNTIIKRRVKAIEMIFILVFLFTFLVFIPILGDYILEIIKEVITDEKTINILERLFGILKYPITVIILYANIKLTYIMAPDKDIPPSTTTVGAIFTTIGWIISTEIFSFYISNFAGYNVFYGSISDILVLLIWVFLLSYVYTLGMVINASNYRGEL